MTETTQDSPAPEVRCPNCSSSQVGRYCASCGQKAGSLHTPIGGFVREALDKLFSFDSRVWRSLIALFRHPGSLTVHYWEGRRAQFVKPLRLYLFASFVTFLFLATVVPDFVFQAGTETSDVVKEALEPGEMDPDSRYIMIARIFVWRVPEDGIIGQALRLFEGREIQDPERVQTLVVGRMAWTVFALVPVFAALLRLLYRRRERFFVPHLVFALHYHTLGFLLMAAGIGAESLLGIRPYVSNLAFLAVAAMLFPSLRCVYGEGRLKTIGKQLVLLLAYGFVVLIGMLGLVAVASRAA